MRFLATIAPQGAALAVAPLGLIWIAPFCGLLLSIACLPFLSERIWNRHFGKVAIFWSVLLLVPYALRFGWPAVLDMTLDAVLRQYLPFVILLFALFVIAGGVRIVGNLAGSPGSNAAILAFGALIASLLGTTGASMLLIRPLAFANRRRRHKTHIFVFFIFLVCNIGGALTPLGDPPLFLGYLNGVSFLWTFKNMLAPTLLACAILLTLFYAIERFVCRRGEGDIAAAAISAKQIRIEGLQNLLYLGAAVGVVLASGDWGQGIAVPVTPGLTLPASGLARDAALLAIALLSWRSTPASIRIENAFTWRPIQEVAFLFAGVFITIAPAIALLRDGSAGALAPLAAVVSHPDGSPSQMAYFWLAGGLSSFLDNAPTYLAFFNLAGGSAAALTGPLSSTLLAISVGAVFMGANTYIGNAPNFMVKTICEERGVKMPGFFGFILWSAVILGPIYILLAWLFFS